MSDTENIDELVKSIENAVDDTPAHLAMHRLRLAAAGLAPFRTHESPVVHAHPVQHTPISKSHTAPIDYTNCGGCGYMHKSITECPRCSQFARLDGEAKHYHQR